MAGIYPRAGKRAGARPAVPEVLPFPSGTRGAICPRQRFRPAYDHARIFALEESGTGRRGRRRRMPAISGRAVVGAELAQMRPSGPSRRDNPRAGVLQSAILRLRIQPSVVAVAGEPEGRNVARAIVLLFPEDAAGPALALGVLGCGRSHCFFFLIVSGRQTSNAKL